MICKSCYGLSETDFCLSCRKLLFDKKRISSTLDFDPGTYLERSADLSKSVDQYFAEKNGHSNNMNIPFHQTTISLSGKKLEPYLNIVEQDFISPKLPIGVYILKYVDRSSTFPFSEDFIENEHLTMQIAEKVYGIQTVANALLHLPNGQNAFLTRRADFINGEFLHSENLEQLSDRVKKLIGQDFQFEGSYEEIAKLIRKYVSAYLPALEVLYKRIIFNYLFNVSKISFSDFSIIQLKTGESKLSPATNLLNTALHVEAYSNWQTKLYRREHESSNREMKLSKEDQASSSNSKNEDLIHSDLLEFAEKIGIMKNRASRMLNTFQTINEPVIELIRSSFLNEKSKEKYIQLFSDKLEKLRQQ